MNKRCYIWTEDVGENVFTLQQHAVLVVSFRSTTGVTVGHLLIMSEKKGRALGQEGDMGGGGAESKKQKQWNGSSKQLWRTNVWFDIHWYGVWHPEICCWITKRRRPPRYADPAATSPTSTSTPRIMKPDSGTAGEPVIQWGKNLNLDLLLIIYSCDEFDYLCNLMKPEKKNTIKLTQNKLYLTGKCSNTCLEY